MEKGDNSSVEMDSSVLGKDFKLTMPKSIRKLLGFKPGATALWVYDKRVDGSWVRLKKED